MLLHSVTVLLGCRVKLTGDWQISWLCPGRDAISVRSMYIFTSSMTDKLGFQSMIRLMDCQSCHAFFMPKMIVTFPISPSSTCLSLNKPSGWSQSKTVVAGGHKVMRANGS